MEGRWRWLRIVSKVGVVIIGVEPCGSASRELVQLFVKLRDTTICYGLQFGPYRTVGLLCTL